MHGRACKQYIFRSYNTSIFSAVSFDGDPFTYQCEKEDKKAEVFQISHIYGSFLNDFMAVKGLRAHNLISGKKGRYLDSPRKQPLDDVQPVVN